MPRVVFTSHLQRHVACQPQSVEGETVRAALAEVFSRNAPLQRYIVDEAFRLRQHVTIFVDGRPLADRPGLSDPLGPDSEVYVMQALSGG